MRTSLNLNKLKVQQLNAKKAATHRKKNVITYKIFTARWNNWIPNTIKKEYIAKYRILSKKNRVDEVT